MLAWWVTGGLIVFFVLLQVRHAFHGSIMWGAQIASLENYAYSLALLLLALSTLGLGLVRESRALRVVALCGMLVCSIKVFAFDMRQLEGLLRVLSFLGLGASLMGLGYVYNRFTPARRELAQ